MVHNRFIRSVSIDWDRIPENSWLRDIEALTMLKTLEFSENITFFAGENGTGKSTLLEAIAAACGLNPEGGTMNYRFETYHDVSELGGALRLTKGFKQPRVKYFFRAESFFNMASKAEEYDMDNPNGISYGGRRLHQQSHGESFLAFMQSFDGEGLYIMDEPEAALSPQRQLTLFVQMAGMAQKGAQFIAATHSPILLGIPGAEILSFDDGRICTCAYEKTQSYQVMEMFINNRDRLVRQLLS